MSDIVEELLTQLDSANAQLKEKEELIEKLRAESVSSSEATVSSKLFLGIAKALKIKDTTVLQTATANSIRIEFPRVVRPQLPALISQQSLRTQFREELNALQPCLKQRADMQTEYQQKLHALEEEFNKKKEALTSSYEEAKGKVDAEIKTFLGTLQSSVAGGLLAESGSLAVYSIERIDPDNRQIVLRKMTDANGIVLLNEKVENRDMLDLSGVYCLSTPEAAMFYESLSGDMHTIHIQYQLIDIGEGEKACCPYHFDPDTVNMEDYEINFQKSENAITKVTNKKDGEVRFVAVQVDTDCGFVASSVVQLYTLNLSPSLFNIIHVHVDDISEEIPIEAVYVLPEQDTSEYFDFNTDARGIALRYKVLVQEGKVRAVLYNPGGGVVNEIPFVERSIEADTLVRYGECIAKIVTMPTGMIARGWESRDAMVPETVIRETPISFCNHRHIEDMPGLVEIQLIFDGKKLVQQNTIVAVPICELQPVTPEDTRILDTIREEEESSRLQVLSHAAEELTVALAQYKSGGHSSPQEMLVRLRDASSSLRSVLRSEASTYSTLLQQCDRALRALAIEIRTQGS